MSPDYHVVVWTAHHVVCDGWSGGLIISELAKIYSALRQQSKQPELDQPVPFSEYALAAQIGGNDVNASLDYWCERFATLPPPLELPTDRPRRPGQDRSRVYREAAPGRVGAAVDQAGRAQLRTTQVVLLVAGLKTLLHRLTGQPISSSALEPPGRPSPARTAWSAIA